MMSDQELQVLEQQEREAPTSSPPVVVGQGLAQRKARLALSRGGEPAQIAKAMRQFGLVDDDAVWEALHALVGNHVCAQVAMVLRPPQDVHSVGTTTAPVSEPAPQPKIDSAPQPKLEPAPQPEAGTTRATGEISNDEAKTRLTQGASAIVLGFTLFELIDRFNRFAALKHLLCTDIVRDGQLAGPNLELYAQLRERYPQIEVQAAGGVRSGDDVTQLAALGVSGVVIGKALMARQAHLPELLVAARRAAAA